MFVSQTKPNNLELIAKKYDWKAFIHYLSLTVSQAWKWYLPLSWRKTKGNIFIKVLPVDMIILAFVVNERVGYGCENLMWSKASLFFLLCESLSAAAQVAPLIFTPVPSARCSVRSKDIIPFAALKIWCYTSHVPRFAIGGTWLMSLCGICLSLHASCFSLCQTSSSWT